MKIKISKIIGLMGFLLLTLPFPAHAAKMALSPASGNFIANCPVALNIIVNTEGKDTMATDAFLRYDPNQIEILDQMAGVGGVQIKPGSVYESYPGNITSNGVIRMTAFNRQGFFNGRGVLGSIVFKAKPGVTSSSFRFDFSPGRTTDSNVANVDSNDILNATYGGTYSFKPGKCGSDTTPPDVTDQKPAPGDINVPLDSEIVFTLSDNIAGVDINTVKVQINDITYQYDKTDDSTFKVEGKPNHYLITIKPVKAFLDREPVVVKISGMDLNGNQMSDQIYSFNELMPVTACQPRTIIKEGVRPAAPEAVSFGLSDWWPWWFVLLCSLILNLKLWSDRQKTAQQKEALPAKPEKRPVRMAIRPIRTKGKKVK